MPLCRLCGNDKSSDELVISLLEELKCITFKDLVEYYCRFTFDPDPDLPQLICRACKETVVKFSELSYTGEINQALFEKNESSVDSEKIREPEAKKLKFDDAKNDTVLEEIISEEKWPESEDEDKQEPEEEIVAKKPKLGVVRKSMRARTESIYVKQKASEATKNVPGYKIKASFPACLLLLHKY